MADSIQGEPSARSNMTEPIQDNPPAQCKVADPGQEEEVVAAESEDTKSSTSGDSMWSEDEGEVTDEDEEEDCDSDNIHNLCPCCSGGLLLRHPSKFHDNLGWFPEDEQTKTYAIEHELPPLPRASRDENDYIRMQYRWGPNDKLVHERAGLPVGPREMVPLDMTLEKMETRFNRYQSLWLQSCSYRYLRDAVLYQISKGKRNVSKCIIFGSGSPTDSNTPNWIVAMAQIAVLKSIADVIETHSGVRLMCYAQEPSYNDLDEKFLLGMGISEVIPPEGFNLVDEEAFVFSPGAQMPLERQIMHSGPGLWVHRPIMQYLPEGPESKYIRNGELIPYNLVFLHIVGRIPVSCSRLEDLYNTLHEIYDDPESGWQTRARDQVEIGIQMTENFRKEYEWATLPPAHDRRLQMAFGDGQINLRLWATKADKSEAGEHFHGGLRCVSNYACGDIKYIPDPKDTEGDLDESKVGSCWIHSFNENHVCGDEDDGFETDEDDEEDDEDDDEEEEQEEAA